MTAPTTEPITDVMFDAWLDALEDVATEIAAKKAAIAEVLRPIDLHSKSATPAPAQEEAA